MRLTEGRAVFVTIPPLLAEIIVRVVCEDIGLKLIAGLHDRGTLAEQLPAFAPDLVVLGLHAGETDQIGAFVLGLVPAAKVLVLSDDGRCAYLHEMQIRRTVLQDFSLAGLRAALAGSEYAAGEQHPPPED